MAPAHLDVEVVSSLRRHLREGALTEAEVRSALVDYTDLGIQTWPADQELRARMLDLAHNLTPDDAAYAVLAEALAATLVTRDAPFAAAVPSSVSTLLV